MVQGTRVLMSSHLAIGAFPALARDLWSFGLLLYVPGLLIEVTSLIWTGVFWYI